jgi:hypothetical protein
MDNDTAEVLRVEGEILRSLGDLAGARAALEAGMESVERLGAEIHRERLEASLAALDDAPAQGYAPAV